MTRERSCPSENTRRICPRSTGSGLLENPSTPLVLADVLTEQAQFSLAETQQIMRPRRDGEIHWQRASLCHVLNYEFSGLYFFRLMDTDVTRIARDLKRQMDKGVEEREKEIKAIRSGR
jgi:hypothetical protein